MQKTKMQQEKNLQKNIPQQKRLRSKLKTNYNTTVNRYPVPQSVAQDIRCQWYNILRKNLQLSAGN